MSRLLITTALAGLLMSAGAASAQPQDHHGRSGQRTAQAPATPPAAAPKPGDPGAPNYYNFFGPGNQRDNNRASGNRGGQPSAPAAGNRNDNDRRGDNRGSDRNRGPQSAPQNAMRGPNPGNRGFNNPPRSRNNFSAYHRNFNAPRRFRAPAYVRPRGWYAHRWTFGEILPSLFWTSNYWLNDYYYYGLEAPPPGTVWVRDGFDALLIDRYNGEIIQVVYDVFY